MGGTKRLFLMWVRVEAAFTVSGRQRESAERAIWAEICRMGLTRWVEHLQQVELV
jgi:hypothetical protein